MNHESDMWLPPQGIIPYGREYKKERSLKPQNILLPGVRHGVQRAGQYGSTKSWYIHAKAWLGTVLP